MSDLQCRFYVYAIYRPDSNEPQYVGQSGRFARWKDHISKAKRGRHDNPGIVSLVQQWDDALEFLILQRNVSEVEAKATEIALIEHFGRADLGQGPLLNLTNGGDGTAGLPCSVEHRARIGNGNRGKKRSQETIKKLRESHLGKKRSPAAVEKTRIANSGRQRSQEVRIKISVSQLALNRKGWKHTPEAIEKIRLASLNAHAKRRMA